VWRFVLTRWLHPGYETFLVFRILLDQIRFLDYECAVPFLPRGRLAIVTDAGRDAVDAEGAIDERR
jgi:hypothetical protein